MTDLPDALSPKLTKLFPLLGSDKDGEVLGAARAIRRALASAGRDLHDLAAAVTRPDPPVQVIYRDPLRSYGRHPDPDGQRRDLGRVNWLLLAPEGLSLKEAEFLRSIRSRLADGCPLTPRQSEWLDAIHRRVSREYA